MPALSKKQQNMDITTDSLDCGEVVVENDPSFSDMCIIYSTMEGKKTCTFDMGTESARDGEVVARDPTFSDMFIIFSSVEGEKHKMCMF